MKIAYTRLGRLVSIGEGADGAVFQPSGFPGDVFKEFKTPDFSADALRELVATFSDLPESSRDWLSSRSVWPTTLVEKRKKCVGFLMPRIPDECFSRYGIRAYPRRVELDWNRLAYRQSRRGNPNIVSEIPDPTEEQVLKLLLDLFATSQILHQADFIIGDISGRNVLWRLSPEPSVVLIDNDGFRRVGESGVTRPKESPDWEDPYLAGSYTSQQSDVYKLALAAYRALWVTTGTPTKDFLRATGLSRAQARIGVLITESTARGGRPTLDHWVAELKTAIREKNLEGRPIINLPRPGRMPASRTLSTPESRPVIKLPRHGKS